MSATSFENLCIFHLLDGLSDGLSHFSGPSRAALVYAVRPGDPLRIYDPQFLLEGHEPKLRQYYLDSASWDEEPVSGGSSLRPFQPVVDEELQLAGLITFGGRSPSCHYQMWFTEHHPDMCSTGPTMRWLEHAVALLSQDLATRNIMCMDTSGYVLKEYATHAVRDYIVDERNRMMGWDTQLRIYPTLDAVLGISKTMEEGVWPRGKLVFVEPGSYGDLNFLLRFPSLEQPRLTDFKHVRKLLQSVEGSDRKLVSDGRHIVGVAVNPLPSTRVEADFRGGHGFLCLGKNLVCSFSDGRFSSSTRQSKLVQLEEILLESHLDEAARHVLFQAVGKLVHSGEDQKHGCTIVVDLGIEPMFIAGQHLEVPLDMVKDYNIDLAKSLSRVDGALHLGGDLKLHGFACLLDGRSVPGENRARGARYNSAVRFTAENEQVVVVVVSKDRPASIIQHGVELTASCEWKPLSGCISQPPLLTDWVKS